MLAPGATTHGHVVVVPGLVVLGPGQVALRLGLVAVVGGLGQQKGLALWVVGVVGARWSLGVLGLGG